LKALPSLPFAAETRPAALRIKVRPVSSVLMRCHYVYRWSYPFPREAVGREA
jgi:uncharacterized membrane protein